MPRNKIVGKNTRKGSNKATGRNYKKESSYNKKKTSYRSALNKEARKKGVYGKRYAKGVDLSHTKSGKTVLEKRSKNRARNGSNGRSTKK